VQVGASWGGFGANYWDAEVRPEPDGNIPSDYARVTMRLTFHDGGHSDWALKYEEIRGRLLHAASVARETGNTQVLNMVTDEQLPEYSPREGSQPPSQTVAGQVEVEQQAEEAAREREENQVLPDEPPPGYDEAQAQAIAMRLDERVREDAERGQ
jgi:WW domain-binding protein 2